MDAGGSVHNGEMALDETCLKEVARFRVCPREKLYGIQVPKMAWHSIVVHEPSVIFEAKDGAYAPLGPEAGGNYRHADFPPRSAALHDLRHGG